MAPRAQRMAPPYVQVSDHYRRRILAGELASGTRLPGNRDIAQEWGVSVATVSKALSLLQVEGMIATSPQGTFVAGEGVVATPRDFVRKMRRLRPGEQDVVTEAGVVAGPPYVCELLGVDVGSDVVRREWVTTEKGPAGRRASRLSVSWFVAEFASVPGLTAVEPIPEGADKRIAGATGRRARHARDYVMGRGSDAREAAALGLPIGTPILACTYLWWDSAGVIEYGEFCLLPNRTISYEYEVVDDGEEMGE